MWAQCMRCLPYLQLTDVFNVGQSHGCSSVGVPACQHLCMSSARQVAVCQLQLLCWEDFNFKRLAVSRYCVGKQWLHMAGEGCTAVTAPLPGRLGSSVSCIYGCFRCALTVWMCVIGTSSCSWYYHHAFATTLDA
jgi:hypothetical protein